MGKYLDIAKKVSEATKTSGVAKPSLWRVLLVLPNGEERWMTKHELFCWIAREMGQAMLGGVKEPLAKPDLGHLFSTRDELVARLNKATDVIVELKASGKDAARAEATWLELIEEYKLVEDQLSLLARKTIAEGADGGIDD
ncbi:MAG: hypothetical protein HY675_21345 [Chloroflexi bacterium]|nr:hypothetical protein [Chloroflexota bacterium]